MSQWNVRIMTKMNEMGDIKILPIVEVKILENFIQIEVDNMPDTRALPTLGESVDHYGEEYCAHAVNMYEELKSLVKQQIGTFAELSDEQLTDSDSIWLKDAQKAIAKAEGK